MSKNPHPIKFTRKICIRVSFAPVWSMCGLGARQYKFWVLFLSPGFQNYEYTSNRLFYAEVGDTLWKHFGSSFSYAGDDGLVK